MARKERATLNEKGQEVGDPKPLAPPVGWTDTPSMFDIVRNMIRSAELAREAEAAGAETFEEADDFDVGDDFDPSSPYENEFDVPLDELKRRAEAGLKAGYDDQFDRTLEAVDEKVKKRSDGEEAAEEGGSPNKPPPGRRSEAK